MRSRGPAGAQQAMALAGGDDALSVAQLYGRVERALQESFPRQNPLWVRGEIQSIHDQARTGHCYLDLVDPDHKHARQPPLLRVKCWRTTWAPIRMALRRAGVVLEPGMVVVIRGALDVYAPRAEIGFILDQLDVTALLGRLAAQRAALIEALRAEGLLGANRALQVPAVPLRIGLVASVGTEGYHDFMGQLEASPFAFQVVVARSSVQGRDAPLSLAAGLVAVGRAGCDLAVLVRGGGGRHDLVAFDAEVVARAVATSPVPVWTGVGHTGDESVADLVANRCFITPTACGRALVDQVGDWWERAAGAAATVVQRAERALATAQQRDDAARRRLAGSARHQLRVHEGGLSSRTVALARGGPAHVGAARRALTTRAARVTPAAHHHMARTGERLDGLRRLLHAYDVNRQLERGYTLTLDAGGRILRSARLLAQGDPLTTRFADGTVRSVVASPGDDPVRDGEAG